MTKSVQQKYFQAIVFLLSCSPALFCHGTLKTSGITEEEKKIILQEHNKLRQLVATGEFPGQPAAENMQEIVWDTELAYRAQLWANNCEFRHDPNRTIKRFTMGQNLAIIWSTAPLEADDGDFPSRIKNWFNEVQKYVFGASWSPKTGHYSQLVWGETNLIGCGYSEYKDKAKYNKLYVCNYGPGGNVVGYNPYEIGKPSCKNYGMDPSPRYKGLCMDSTLAPYNSSFYNKFGTYEHKQNTFITNTKTTYKTSIFNKPQQADNQASSYGKQPSALPVPTVISPSLSQQQQPKADSSNIQLQQETKHHLSFSKNFNSQQFLSRTNISPHSQSTEKIISQQQKQQEEKHPLPQYHYQQQQQQQHQPLEQQQQIEIITLDTNPNEVIAKPTKTDWSFLTRRS